MSQLSDLELKQRVWDVVNNKWDSVNSTGHIGEELGISVSEAIILLEEMVESGNIREVIQKPTPTNEFRCWTTCLPAT